MKRLIALAMLLVMVLSLTTVAFADERTFETATITAPSDKDHFYAVYQIFKADLETDAAGLTVLTDAVWGANGTGTPDAEVPAEVMKAISDVNDGRPNTDKLAIIETYVNLESTPVAVVSNGHPAVVPTGYYLIADLGHDQETPNVSADGEGLSLFIVRIAEDITINPKAGNTSSEKKVLDDDHDHNDWQDSADYDIGDEVPFQLTAHVASDYAHYVNGYKLTFHDVMDPGLTFNKDSVKVYIDNVELTTGFTVRDSGMSDACTFEVHFDNLKAINSIQAGSRIDVRYTATLNTNAKIGAEGNDNKSHITFTNNPNDTQAGENGKTPDDLVTVFTFTLVVNKFANNEETPLNGAEFSLYKGTANEMGDLVKKISGDNTSVFTFKGLDAGHYVLVESVTPNGYNSIKPIEILITADHDVESTDPKLNDLEVTPSDRFTVDLGAGTISGYVINFSGVTLPTTGGTGTTLILVLGGILFAVAAVLLITKKRVGTKS